ncbi:cyclase family protein [Anoxynatronum buryatiense]|uniref:Kynurenine formamidase n=1 Tax=Anoxynatronum buryatiense TaxID=489973 RepID=A0AA45WXF1_9CLOT|nr:cyclase family protein [Anoxynatronum buryatiense]SMP62502.1 Kynurenine formamidase [Anoxynatronum buryatiense]
MKVIDLSHAIEKGMPIFPGDPEPSIESAFTHEQDSFHVNRLLLGSHTGTHIDAPYHIDPLGDPIDTIPIHRFVGMGVKVVLTQLKAETPITPVMLAPSLQEAVPGDFLIIHTGWDHYFHHHDHYQRHPYLTPEAAQMVVEKQMSLIAIDALNVDPTRKEIYPAHEILMKNNCLIVENLCRLDQIKETRGLYAFLPLKLKGADGSPVRGIYLQL